MCLVVIGLITYTPCDWTFSYATHHTTLHSVTMLYFCMFCESALMSLQLIIFPIFFKRSDNHVAPDYLACIFLSDQISMFETPDFAIT